MRLQSTKTLMLQSIELSLDFFVPLSGPDSERAQGRNTRPQLVWKQERRDHKRCVTSESKFQEEQEMKTGNGSEILFGIRLCLTGLGRIDVFYPLSTIIRTKLAADLSENLMYERLITNLGCFQAL